AFDHEHALAGEDEECLLAVLAVIPARRLTGLEHTDVEPELREAAADGLEAAQRAERRALRPGGVPRVEHEPAVAFRDEALLGLDEPGFLDHLSSSFAAGRAGGCIIGLCHPATACTFGRPSTRCRSSTTGR